MVLPPDGEEEPGEPMDALSAAATAVVGYPISVAHVGEFGAACSHAQTACLDGGAGCGVWLDRDPAIWPCSPPNRDAPTG
ncbi:hypothetical protein G6F57_023302 [Rhizopus arrhizus]|nr:hypothetical protein G6F57_023302 [Rhizopus arrhizus]